MRLLVKVAPIGAFLFSAAHIPGPEGHPLCGVRLNIVNWMVQDRDVTGLVVCNNCRKRAAKLNELSG